MGVFCPLKNRISVLSDLEGYIPERWRDSDDGWTENDDKRYDALVARYNKANDRLEAVTAEISGKELRRATMRTGLAAMEKLPTALDTFDETAFHSLVDYITVYSNEDVRVILRMARRFRRKIWGGYDAALFLVHTYSRLP